MLYFRFVSTLWHVRRLVDTSHCDNLILTLLEWMNEQTNIFYVQWFWCVTVASQLTTSTYSTALITDAANTVVLNIISSGVCLCQYQLFSVVSEVKSNILYETMLCSTRKREHWVEDRSGNLMQWFEKSWRKRSIITIIIIITIATNLFLSTVKRTFLYSPQVGTWY